MKSQWWLLAALLAAAALAQLATNYPGHVTLALPEWIVEINLVAGGILLSVAFVMLHALLNLIARLGRVPARIRERRRAGYKRRERSLQHDGLRALIEGNWEKAERQLGKGAGLSDRPLIFYLGAAEAAHKLGAEERCRRYLRLAEQHDKNATLSTGILRSRLHEAAGRREEAIECLEDLRKRYARTRILDNMLLELKQEAGDWEKVLAQLDRMNLTAEKRRGIEVRAYRELIRRAGRDRDWDGLERIWGQRLTGGLRHEPELLRAYVEEAIRLGASRKCEALLRARLRRRYDSTLALLYALVPDERPERQLRFVEAMLQRHERDATLLFAAGLLCARLELWGKADSYLETSVDIEPRPETLRALAALREREGRLEAATASYRAAMELLMADSGGRKASSALPLLPQALSLLPETPLEGKPRSDLRPRSRP